jgi:predicted ATP-binding protein involved in virulence
MPVLPCISYYGTERLWGARDFELAAKDNEDEDPSRLYGYRNCLIPNSGFLLFSRWYRNQSFAAWQEATSGDPGQSYHPGLAIKAVNTAVLSMLEQQGWVDMRWSTSPKGLMLKHATKGWFPIGHTSDGITNIVGMVADIAYRCVRLNPEFNDQAPQKTPGIVLIDEVDMHLHPSWQQNIIGSLQKAFPLIQFIVTTHSPNVLSTVQAESIRMLSITPEGSGQAITPDRQTQGVESASVLAQVMGVDPIPNLQIAKDLSTYTALIQQGLGASDEAKGLRRVLDEHFGLDHPSMQTCDRLLRYQAFKVRLENKGTQ